MNRKQRLILLVVVVFVIGLFLFPPANDVIFSPEGYRVLPTYGGHHFALAGGQSVTDYGLLWAEWGLVIILGLLAVIACRTRKP